MSDIRSFFMLGLSIVEHNHSSSPRTLHLTATRSYFTPPAQSCYFAACVHISHTIATLAKFNCKHRGSKLEGNPLELLACTQ